MNEKIVFTDQYFSYSQQEVKILTFTYTCNEESRYPVDWNVPGIVPWFYSAHYLTQQGTTIREWVPISSFSLNWSKILLLNYSVYNICGGQILGCVWKYPDKEFIFSINYETHLSCKKNAIHKNLTPPPTTTKISWNALTSILVQNCSITFKDNLSQNFFFSTQSFF